MNRRRAGLRLALRAVVLVGPGALGAVPTLAQGTCNINIGATGVDAQGRPYASLSYAVSLPGVSSQSPAGYQITRSEGPQGEPETGSCAGGFFTTGNISGTCSWFFTSGGSVRFRLVASGGNQGGNCSAQSAPANVPA